MIRTMIDKLLRRDRCDMPAHRKLGHADAAWEYVAGLQCWRRLCVECGTLTGVSDRRPRGADIAS